MKIKMKPMLCAALCLILLVPFAGCGTQTPATSSTPAAATAVAATESSSTPAATAAAATPVATSAKALVEIPILMRNSGNDSGMKLNQAYIDGFNKENDGKYKLVVEWMPGVAEDIRAKLKMLNASNDLPALVTDLGAEPAFSDLLAKNGRLVDLKPYFDSSPEWQKVCFPASIAYNTKDGKMFTSPSTVESYVGLFYNKELFTKAGIATFPKTWDEFWAACEKLKAAKITPISLHTTETGWCPMLLGTSNMASSEEGMAFMEQQYPTNFDAPVFKDTMNIIKKAFTFSTPDAVGGNYALAANNFCAGKTAMIPNGPWMIPSLSDTQFSPAGFDAKVGYSHFPSEVMLSSQGKSYGYGVSVDHPKDVQDGTVEYIKYMVKPENIRLNGVISGALSNLVPLTEDDLKQLSLPMQEYAKAVSSVKKLVIIYQGKWDPIVQNEVIPADLPSLIGGQITVDEFCAKMVDGAKKYAAENK